jgi:hypothetical protein
MLDNSGGTVVGHLPHHCKVKGLSPAAAEGTRRERNGENNSFKFKFVNLKKLKKDLVTKIPF